MTQNNSRRPKKMKKSKVLPTDGWTNRRTDGPTNGAGCRVACTRLKRTPSQTKYGSDEVRLEPLEGWLGCAGDLLIRRILGEKDGRLVEVGKSWSKRSRLVDGLIGLGRLMVGDYLINAKWLIVGVRFIDLLMV